MRIENKHLLLAGDVEREDITFIDVGGSSSNIEYISLRLMAQSPEKSNVWIKWGEFTYCYIVSLQDMFMAIATYFETESLGKMGNFIKQVGELDWSDSPTARETIEWIKSA
tara:strand:- start:193 stop:525 length:333 start_codon:yes stop_codon:yes gene_type:complete